MPNHGKGGRPLEREEAKRAAVAVRTTPTIKAKLQAAAEEAGRSLTQEIEARLEASLDRVTPATVETERLLAELESDIERAESLTGKRWHKDLRTWAMVREALASGEIERQCPEHDRFFTDVDGDVADQRTRMLTNAEQRKAEMHLIERLGFPGDTFKTSRGSSTYLDYPEARAILKQCAFGEGIMEQISKSLNRLESLDAEMLAISAEYEQGMKWAMDAINDGALAWEKDLAERGIRLAREYRPNLAAARPNLLSTATMLAALGGTPTTRH